MIGGCVCVRVCADIISSMCVNFLTLVLNIGNSYHFDVIGLLEWHEYGTRVQLQKGGLG